MQKTLASLSSNAKVAQIAPPSSSWLEKRLKRLAQQVPLNPVIYSEGADLKWPDAKVVDLIFLGDVLRVLTKPLLLPPNQPVRIWVLSRAFQKVFFAATGLRAGLIPRYSLVRSKTPRALSGRQFTLVISARASLDKNVHRSLELASRLQKSYGDLFQVEICGPYFDAKFWNEFIDRYEWNSRPTLSGDLGFEWTKRRRKNAVLIDLSTFAFEDFGVSVAQAEEAGWPMVLSRWGGHLDVRGSRVFWITREDLQKDWGSLLPKLLSSLQRQTRIAPAPKAMVKGARVYSTRRLFEAQSALCSQPESVLIKMNRLILKILAGQNPKRPQSLNKKKKRKR